LSKDEIKAEVDRYLRTGDTDLIYAAWPGSFMERAKRAHRELREALTMESSFQKQRDDDWVFPSRNKGKPPSRDNVFRRHIAPMLKSAGLGWVNFHVMRRTHATLMNEIVDDPKLVADQLGHTLDVNLNIYTRASLARLKNVVDALEGALCSAKPIEAE
jgi:integrase